MLLCNFEMSDLPSTVETPVTSTPRVRPLQEAS
jgi:hypothetical protein